MKIKEIRTTVVAVPLETPTAFATTVVTAREYVIVEVETIDGAVGTGFAVGGRHAGEARLIAVAISECLTPHVIGEDARCVERLWKKMFDSTVIVGRRGAVLRGISAIDIALWDLKGRVAGEPLYRLLGGFRSEVPAYASGGYYREGKGLQGLADEVGRYVAMGFDSVKIKVGRLDPRADAERVRVARQTIGPHLRLALDANNAWPDAATAINAFRHFEPYDIWWLEEPVMPDSMGASAAVAAAIGIPVAAGELEGTRWGFRSLLDQRAAAILQADATVAGGVTEWMRIAHMAAGSDIPMAPHWMANVHVHLVGAVPNGLVVEYFVLEEDVLNFERLVSERLAPHDGLLPVPPAPGHGIVLDGDAVARFTVG